MEIGSSGPFYYRIHTLRNTFGRVLMITFLIFCIYACSVVWRGLVFLSIADYQLDLFERVANIRDVICSCHRHAE